MDKESVIEVPVEIQIDNFIKEQYKYEDQKIKDMQIQDKMSLINMRNKDKWEEFKLGLRKSGYII